LVDIKVSIHNKFQKETTSNIDCLEKENHVSDNISPRLEIRGYDETHRATVPDDLLLSNTRSLLLLLLLSLEGMVSVMKGDYFPTS